MSIAKFFALCYESKSRWTFKFLLSYNKLATKMSKAVENRKSGSNKPKEVRGRFGSLAFRLADRFVVIKMLVECGLTGVLLFILVFSPWIILPSLMGWPVPYCYVAFGIWAVYFGGSVVLAAVVGYLRESGRRTV